MSDANIVGSGAVPEVLTNCEIKEEYDDRACTMLFGNLKRSERLSREAIDGAEKRTSSCRTDPDGSYKSTTSSSSSANGMSSMKRQKPIPNHIRKLSISTGSVEDTPQNNAPIGSPVLTHTLFETDSRIEGRYTTPETRRLSQLLNELSHKSAMKVAQEAAQSTRSNTEKPAQSIHTPRGSDAGRHRSDYIPLHRRSVMEITSSLLRSLFRGRCCSRVAVSP
jgi:hypothetical protein